MQNRLWWFNKFAHRNADVLLIMCPPWSVDMPPLGIAYLSEYLHKKGFKSEILDINIDSYLNSSADLKKYWEQKYLNYWEAPHFFVKILPVFEPIIEMYVKKIISSQIKIIGFSVNQANAIFSLEIAKRLKYINKDIIVIFGGPAISWLKGPSGSDLLVNNYIVETKVINAFVIGEGEETLYDVLRILKKNKRLGIVKGSMILENNRYSMLIPRGYTRLDRLPFPTFQGFQLQSYYGRDNADAVLPIIFSKGCINRCHFCNDFVMSGYHRYRPAKNVFKEICYHIRHAKIRRFQFCDILLNGNLNELNKLCGLIINKKLRVKFNLSWTGQIVVRSDMSLALFKKMKEAGCDGIVYGIESFSESLLRKMNKYKTFHEIKLVIDRAKQAGIKVFINLIVGFPGETQDEFFESIKFLRDNANLIDGISSVQTCSLTVGSKIFNKYQEFNIFPPDGDWAGWGRTWQSGDGNTFEKRSKNLEYLCLSAQEAGIEIISKQTYEDAA